MQIPKQREPVSQADRWLSLIGGSALVFYGLKRRSWWSSTLAVAGANFVVRGVTGQGHAWEVARQRRRSLAYGAGVKVRRSVILNKSPEEIYRFWRNFENLPRFMNHLESVHKIDENRSRWRVKGPAGMNIEWDAEIISERPNEMIGWRSLPGATVDNAGSVRFEPAPGGRGTVVRVQLQYNPPGGRLGSAIARLFGEEPDQQLQEDLRRLKQLMEAGEIPTTEGQPSGRPEDREQLHERRYRVEEGRRVEPVETGSELSFPASDPPAWTTGRA